LYNIAVKEIVKIFSCLVVKGQNPNIYKWPEAESNCRPLVFKILANFLIFNYVYNQRIKDH